jgi:hypothetical protein
MPLWCLPSQVCQGVLITCLSHPLSSMRAGAGPRSGTGSVGACQRSGIEDLVSDCAVAAGMGDGDTAPPHGAVVRLRGTQIDGPDHPLGASRISEDRRRAGIELLQQHQVRGEFAQ